MNKEYMSNKYIAVIQAGGKGTRLRKLTHDNIPKPLLEMNGKPMMEWQIENLVEYGIKEIVIIIGYLGDKIQDYFGNGSKYGITISYISEKEPLGSAGALYYMHTRQDRDLLFIFGDIMFDLDWKRFIEFHEKKGGLVTLLVHPNSHPYDSDIIKMDAKNKVISFDFKNQYRKNYYDNCVNAGLYIMKSKILNFVENEKYYDLEKDILSNLISEEEVYGYKTSEYVKDAGTPERFKVISEEQKKGLWSRKSLKNLQKCIFLDRDGTINKYKGLISNIEEFELEENVIEAIKLINNSEYLAIIVTNQPVVARGICDIATVEEIHRKMSTLLGDKGAYIDDIVFCPHHPDKGHPEENVKYKIQCNCRKPSTEMIDKMVEKYNIDRTKSYMIGDTTTDIQLGKNTGIRAVLVETGQAGKDKKYNVCADMKATNLLDAVRKILV